jgi:hypothetical protein
MPVTDAQIRAAILTLVAVRGAGRTCCPSEVARSIDPPAWRGLMEAVRAAARALAEEGAIVITQGGVPVPPRASLRGAIRLGLPLSGGLAPGRPQ